jgi:hypothetical protein
MTKNILLNVVKVLFTIFFLAFALRNVDVPAMLSTLAGSRFLFIGIALLVFGLYQFIYVYNWGKILSVLRERVRYRELFRFHMIGLFYNLFLPTSMGGDLAKIYYLSRSIANRLVPIKSIAILRGTGLLTNLFLIAISYAMTRGTVRVEVPEALSGRAPAAASVLLWLAAGAVMVSDGGILRSILARARSFTASMRDFVKYHRKEVVSVLIISFVTQMMIILENRILLAALGIEVPFVDMMFIIPLTFLVTLLPITIAGLGIREGAFIYFLQKYHYTAADAVAFSLLGYSLMLVMGLAGGIVNVASRSKKE